MTALSSRKASCCSLQRKGHESDDSSKYLSQRGFKKTCHSGVTGGLQVIDINSYTLSQPHHNGLCDRQPLSIERVVTGYGVTVTGGAGK